MNKLKKRNAKEDKTNLQQNINYQAKKITNKLRRDRKMQ